MTDTLFADVSEFQTPVNDSYPYPVLSIRTNDGNYRDHHFAQNYGWMRANLDSGRLTFGIIYAYVRPDWAGTVNTMRAMIDEQGGLHPRTALMLDVESGGNPGGDGSDWINRAYWNLVDYCGGNARRVFGYANSYDFSTMWRDRPPGLRMIGAGYGQNPNMPGQIAHQYTDGAVGAGGLPNGCAPFGACDMNAADGLDPVAFAAALGIGSTPGGWLMALDDAQQQEVLDGVRLIRDQLLGTADPNQPGVAVGWPQLGGQTVVNALGQVRDQLLGPDGHGWPQLGQNDQGQNLTLVDAVAKIAADTAAGKA